MRFVHLSPDAPALDLAIKKGPVLFANIPFANASHYISCPFEKTNWKYVLPEQKPSC
ncbi:hypothetical protein QKW52_21435 [Bacillus sonorensis]|nr:hypothetical protein [Bacillus sonorensis]